MQPPRRAIGPVLELSSSVERGEDHLECALFRLGVLVDRHAATIIDDRDRRAVSVQRQLNVLGIAVHRLVDCVVDDLPHQVMETGGSDAADIHTRPLADRVQTFENRDVLGGV